MNYEECVRDINAFFGPKAPGPHGVEFVSISPEVVVRRINVTDALIAGNGFLFAPAVISLADSLCAGGVGMH